MAPPLLKDNMIVTQVEKHHTCAGICLILELTVVFCADKAYVARYSCDTIVKVLKTAVSSQASVLVHRSHNPTIHGVNTKCRGYQKKDKSSFTDPDPVFFHNDNMNGKILDLHKASTYNNACWRGGYLKRRFMFYEVTLITVINCKISYSDFIIINASSRATEQWRWSVERVPMSLCWIIIMCNTPDYLFLLSQI